MRTEDGYIIHKCLNGDKAAFGLLVDKYKASIYALAYSKLGNFHDAEDVTQEAFTKAYQKLRTLRRWDSFLAWLYSITSNLCKEWIQSQAKRPDREFLADQHPAIPDDSSMERYRKNSLHELLHDALDSLPDIYRQVLTLYYLGGMNTTEIGRFLGIAPNTAVQRLNRARSKLRGDIVAMMSKTYRQRRLQADFTFRIVEMVKRLKIQSMPRTTALPWGLALAAGIIFAVMGIGSHLNVSNPVGIPAGSPLPVRMKVLKTGEIPVDVLDSSQITAIASKQVDGDGRGENLDPQNATLMDANGEKGKQSTKADTLSQTAERRWTSGDKELLKLLAQGHQTNLSALKTWSAQVNYVRNENEEPVIVSATDFQFDISAGALRSNTTWQLPSIRQERHIVTYDFRALIAISLDDEGNRIRPEEPTVDGQIRVMSNEIGPDDMNAPGTISLMRYLDSESDLEDFYENWDTEHWVGPLNVEREGDIVTFRMEIADLFNEYKFDLTKGCNLVGFTGGNMTLAVPEGRKTIEWEEVGGLFVPSRYTHVRYDSDTNSISRSEERIFSGNEVNKPIASKVFEPRDLAAGIMSEGDVMIDYVNNVKQVYLGNGSWEAMGPALASREQRK